MPEDTPPSIPLVPATVGTLARQLQGCAGQLHGARNDIDSCLERLALLQQDSADLRRRLDVPPSSAGGASLTPAPRRSIAVQAAVKTGSLGKYTLIVLGALGVAAQVAAVFKPNIVGPIQTLIQLLQALGGHS